jgi:hypothetical protein
MLQSDYCILITEAIWSNLRVFQLLISVYVAIVSYYCVVFQLPGFYYDAERKKYFRVLPSHNKVVTGAVTPEVIELRQTAIQQKAIPNDVDEQTDSHSPRRFYKSENLISLITDRHLGCLTNRGLQDSVLCNLTRNLRHCSYESMASCCSQYVFRHPACLMLNPEQTQLTCLWSVVRQTCGSLYSFVQRYDIVNRQKDSCKQTSLQLKAAGHQTYRPSHISSMCWIGDKLKSFKPVLYTASVVDTSLNTLSYAVIDNIASVNVDIDDAPSVPALYRIGNLWTWSCASNSTGSQFVVGTEKKCLLFDVETGRRRALDTHKSDTLSVCFANTVSDI